jgi:hypothetical protein
LAGVGGIVAGYWGVAELIGRRWESGAAGILIGFTMAGATWIACRHRTDLLYG